MKKFISDYNGVWGYFGKQEHDDFHIYQFYRNDDGKEHMNKPGNNIYILDIRSDGIGLNDNKQLIIFDQKSLKKSLNKNERIRTPLTRLSHESSRNYIDYIENKTYMFQCTLRKPVTEKLMALQTSRQKGLPEDIQYKTSKYL